MILPKGKGWFIWNAIAAENGNAVHVLAAAKEAKISHVLIKIADAIYSFNVDLATKLDLAAPIVRALQSAGIQVFGWSYVYGNNPAGEARAAVSRCKDLGLDGLVYNAEQQFRDLPANKSAAIGLIDTTRYLAPDLSIGLSSYRYPRYHMAFPWKEFLNRVDFYMPQVYHIHATNAGWQLKASYDELRAMAPNLPIIPTGAAFKEHGWVSTPFQILDFLRTAQDLGFDAVNFWEWGHTRRNLPLNWRAVSEYPWPVHSSHPPPPPETSGDCLLVNVLGNMNVRSEPSTVGGLKTIIGSVKAGDVLPVNGIGGGDVWVEYEPGKWVAFQTGGKTYLKQV